MGFPTETTPSEDYLAAKGVAFENNDSTLIDLNASDEIQVKDSYFTTPKTIKSIQLQLDDHDTQHLPNGTDPLATAIAVTLNANSTNTEGNNNSFARSNHTHEITKGTPVTQTPDQTNAEGDSAGFARANHIHNIPTAIPVDTGTANSQGTANSFAKSDHVHKTITGKKAGLADGANFAGTPRTLTITFATPYPNTNYAINITGSIAASWSYESKTVNGFVINSNRNQAFTGEVSWHCITTGET